MYLEAFSDLPFHKPRILLDAYGLSITFLAAQMASLSFILYLKGLWTIKPLCLSLGDSKDVSHLSLEYIGQLETTSLKE